MNPESKYVAASADHHCLIMANSSAMTMDVVRLLWPVVELKICADGGANRLYDGLVKPLDDGDFDYADVLKYLPTCIVGDLDSLRPDVEKFYRNSNVKIVKDDCQNTNDLEKAVELALCCELQETGESIQVESIIVVPKYAISAGGNEPKGCVDTLRTVIIVGALGGGSGRFDQEMAAIHVLHKYAASFNRLMLMSSDSLTSILLPDVDHTLLPIPGVEGPGCGLLPIGGKCESVTTNGLQWNLQNSSLEFGCLVSSSNSFSVQAATDNEHSGNNNRISDTDRNNIRCKSISDTDRNVCSSVPTNGEGEYSSCEGSVKGRLRRSSDPLIHIRTSHPLIWTCDVKLPLQASRQ